MKNFWCSKLLILLMVISAGCGTVRADVFSLFPFQSGGAASGVDNALHSSELWTEEVEINGHRLDLQVALVGKDLNQAVRDLRGLYKNGAAAMNSNSLLFEVPLASGARRRYFLVELKGMIPVLQFSLMLPAGFNRNKNTVWPSELPLPPGAQARTVMRLPKRESVYGQFDSPFPSSQALVDMARRLEGSGWKSMGQESRSSRQAAGEIFLHENGRRIMILSVRDVPSGSGSTGSVYLRKISGK